MQLYKNNSNNATSNNKINSNNKKNNDKDFFMTFTIIYKYLITAHFLCSNYGDLNE